MSQLDEWIRLTAKFAGKCIICNGRIEENQIILWKKGDGAKHENCEQNQETGFAAEFEQNPVNWKDSIAYPFSQVKNFTACQRCGIKLDSQDDNYIQGVENGYRKVCKGCFDK